MTNEPDIIPTAIAPPNVPAVVTTSNSIQLSRAAINTAAPLKAFDPSSGPAPAPAPVKPGWQTTEWYLSLGAMLMTALYAGGVIPTAGIAATITAIAATVLTALGYKVSRTIVKAAALTAVLAIAPAACGGTGAKSPKAAAIDCTGGNSAGIVAQVAATAAKWTSTTAEGGCRAPSGIDWTCIEGKAIAELENRGGCILAEVFATQPAPQPNSLTARAMDPARAALEDFRRRYAGGATFHTTHGDL